MALAQSYLTDIVRTFRYYQQLGDRALAQVSDENLHALLDGESNSIALVIKHLSGNLRSRFGNFLTSDGEKPDRDRDAEFEMPEQASREQVIGWWDEAWKVTFSELDALTPEDVERTVTIRQEPFQAFEALNRLAAHTAYHVGQIVYLAKHFAGPTWTSLTIPRGMSKQATGKYKQIATPSRR